MEVMVLDSLGTRIHVLPWLSMCGTTHHYYWVCFLGGSGATFFFTFSLTVKIIATCEERERASHTHIHVSFPSLFSLSKLIFSLSYEFGLLLLLFVVVGCGEKKMGCDG
jgi:hypothetical protein